MKWEKLGLVFCPEESNEWAWSHAANPVAEHLYDNIFRVYFSPRDKQNRSQIACIEIEIKGREYKVIHNSLRLILSHGKIGYFDDSGVTVTGFINKNTTILLYYLGWNLCKTIPFRNAIGLAYSYDGGKNFTRSSNAPILDRNNIDPISLSYPFVLYDDGIYRMWYGTCEEWNGYSVADYFFSLKYAESKDGINWERLDNFSIRCDRAIEDAIARPHVIKKDNLYKMWYSKKKGASYSIGYAESVDGYSWQRLDDNISIAHSANGWDSEMIEYPFVFDHAGSRYMLYNGNGYGKTGFGLAVLNEL